MSEFRGIFQSDVIIQSAIREALRDMRANPWLLPYIFRSLRDDPLTKKEYGEKQIDAATKWLLKTDFPIFVNCRLEEAQAPAITINLLESSEVDNTLGDKHYDVTVPVDPDDNFWPPLAGPFNPQTWNPQTSELTLPVSVTTGVDVFPCMNIVDAVGTLHSIVDVYDDPTGQFMVCQLAAGTIANFQGSYLKSKNPPVVELESAGFRESFLIGAHVVGEAWQLVVLYSALKLCLLRYRQSLFEARGYQVSSITATDFSKNAAFRGDTVWSRYINLSGKTMDTWPKQRLQTIQGITAVLSVTGAGKLPEETDPDDALWIGDQDALTVGSR